MQERIVSGIEGEVQDSDEIDWVEHEAVTLFELLLNGEGGVVDGPAGEELLLCYLHFHDEALAVVVGAFDIYPDVLSSGMRIDCFLWFVGEGSDSAVRDEFLQEQL